MVPRALSPEICNLKGFERGLMEFPLPRLEANSLAYAINRHLCRGENLVRVRAKLELKRNPFVINNYFAF